jgi:type II secretory pathway component PulC
MSIRQLQSIVSALFLVTVLLMLWAWNTFSQPFLDLDSRPVALPSQASNKTTQDIPLPQTQIFAEALQRPLFEQGRVPFVPKPPVVEAAPEVQVFEEQTPPEPPPQQALQPPPPPQFDLVIKGVFISSTRDTVLIISPAHPAGKWYSTGDMIGEWKITRILESGAKFDSNGQSRELKLYVDNPANTLAPVQ